MFSSYFCPVISSHFSITVIFILILNFNLIRFLSSYTMLHLLSCLRLSFFQTWIAEFWYWFKHKGDWWSFYYFRYVQSVNRALLHLLTSSSYNYDATCLIRCAGFIWLNTMLSFALYWLHISTSHSFFSYSRFLLPIYLPIYLLLHYNNEFLFLIIILFLPFMPCRPWP